MHGSHAAAIWRQRLTRSMIEQSWRIIKHGSQSTASGRLVRRGSWSNFNSLSSNRVVLWSVQTQKVTGNLPGRWEKTAARCRCSQCCNQVFHQNGDGGSTYMDNTEPQIFLECMCMEKKTNPFSGKFLTKQIKVCQGCQKQLHDNNTDPPSLHNWSAGSFWLKLKCLQESPSHYHPCLSCIHMVFPLFQRSTNLVVPQELSFDTWTQGILGKLLEGLVDILHVPICVVSCVL